MNALINPYGNVDWSNSQKILSFSHAHARVKNNDGTKGTVYQRYLDNAVEGGARHIAFSNYYPSEPFYPLSDWFETVPSGILGSPNAEHHNFTDGWGALHMNGVGCTAITGQAGGLAPAGANMTAKGAIKYILNTLQYADGGGVTVNHPGWSVMQNEVNGYPKWTRSNAAERVLELLNMDDRVIGMEIRNSSSYPFIGAGDDSEDNANVNSVGIWDEILLTGKRCWGFCVPDHETEWGSKWTGRNVLLINDFTEHECLKAYRNGNFYSKVFDSDLAFANISFDGTTFSVSAPLADYIQIVIDGVYEQFSGGTASKTIPSNAVYVRAEAWMAYTWTDKNGNSHNVTEKIYSNPIMFKRYVPKKGNNNISQKFITWFD